MWNGILPLTSGILAIKQDLRTNRPMDPRLLLQLSACKISKKSNEPILNIWKSTFFGQKPKIGKIGQTRVFRKKQSESVFSLYLALKFMQNILKKLMKQFWFIVKKFIFGYFCHFWAFTYLNFNQNIRKKNMTFTFRPFWDIIETVNFRPFWALFWANDIFSGKIGLCHFWVFMVP